MLNQLVEVARSAAVEKRKRLARSRRRALGAQLRRTLAAESLEGRLLLASNVTIGSGDDTNTFNRTVGVGTVLYTPITDDALIGDTRVLADLEAGLIVTVDTVNPAGAQEGDIVLDSADLSVLAGVNPTLELQADNDVLFSSTGVSASAGSINVILNSDRDGSGAGRVEIDAGSTINSNGAPITIGGGANPATTPAIGTATVPDGVSIFGAMIAGAGDITIRGQGLGVGGTADADGVLLEGTVDTTSGNITIVGTGGNTSGSGNDGVMMDFGLVGSTSGNISITGVGGGTGAAENGITLTNSALVTVTSGSISISGTASATGTGVGVSMATDGDVIESLGSAPITITGTGSGGSAGLQFTGAVGSVSAAGDITLRTDSFQLLGALAFIEGTGNLNIAPVSVAESIGIGGAAGTLDISDAELALISNGFSAITIGDAVAGSGAVSVDSATFTDPVTIVGGSVSVAGGITGDGGVTLTARDAAAAGQDIAINSGTVIDTTGSVVINAGDDFTLAAGAGLSANNNLDINVDQAPDADAGTGSTVTMVGTTSASNVTITGGADVDTISLESGPTSLGVTLTGADAGEISFGLELLGYQGIENVNSTAASDDVSLTVSGVGPGNTLTVDQPVAGTIRLAASAGQTINVVSPVSSLTIGTSAGAHTVNVNALDVSLPSGLFIQDFDLNVDDTVSLLGDFSNATGGLEIGALNINLNAAINVNDALIIGDPTASGTTTISTPNITSNGTQQYLDRVVLTTSLTLDAPGSTVTFVEGIDDAIAGTNSLTINAGDTVDLSGGIGATPPAALTVSTGGPSIIISGDVTTTGPQIYNDNVELFGTPDIAITSQSGAITFNSTIDDGVQDTTNLTITSGGLTTFASAIGLTNRPLSLAVTSAGPWMPPTFVSARNDILLTVSDSAGSTDDLVIPDGTSISSVLGNVVLTGGDLVDVAAAVSIDVLSGSFSANVDPVAGDPDPDGGTITIAGTISTATSTVLSGGDDADTFNPLTTSSAFDVIGGAPSTAPGDVLNIDAGGANVDVTATSVQVGANPVINITDVEEVRILNTPTILFTGSAGDDELTLRATPTPATTVELHVLGGPNIIFDPAVTTNFDVLGGDGDDAFFVDVSDGVPAVAINFDGEGNVSTNPGDRLEITGSTPAPLNSLVFNYDNANDGSVQIDGTTTINYFGLEPITSTVDADNVMLNYSAATENITVNQPVAGSTTVDSDSGEITTFNNPNVLLEISTGGGADSVTVDGVSLSLTNGLVIADPDSVADDSVSFQNASTTISTGLLDVLAETIDIAVDLSVDGSITLGAAGTGNIDTAATITTAGGISFLEPVTVSSDTVINSSGAGGVVEFNQTVDGPANLTINDTSGSGTFFLADVGATTSLGSLMVGAGATAVFISSIVRSDGDQTYNSPVIANAVNIDLISVNFGTLTFNSTVDAVATGNSLTTNTAGITAFNAPVGGTTVLESIDVTSGGPLTLSTTFDAVNNIQFFVTDVAAAGDDLVITASAAITSISGDVVFDAGDDIDFQTGAQVSAAGDIDFIVDQANEDAGIGSTVIVNGSFNGATTNVTGGTDVDNLLVDGSATNLIFDHTAATTGSIDSDGVVLGFQDMDTIVSSITADNIFFNYGSGDETIAATAGSPGSTTFASTANIYSTTFAHPATNLNLDTGGGIDSVSIDGLDMTLTGIFAINDPGGQADDTVSFVGNPSAFTTGVIDLSVPQIEVATDLTAEGGILFGDSTGMGQIRPSAAIASDGDIVFGEPVLLVGTTAVTTAAGGQVSFPFAVDGPQDLSVTGGTLVEFLDNVGGSNPLTNLDVTSSAGPISIGNVTTTGAQIYNSPVEINGGGGIVRMESGGGGAITFASTLVSVAASPDTLELASTGAITLGGEVGGGGNPLNTLSIQTESPLTISNDVTVDTDVLININDTAATGQNFVVASPATITAASGGLSAIVGDDVDLQPGATITLAAGALSLVVDSLAIDPDAEGALVLAASTITTASGTTINGGADVDAFTVAPQSGTGFDVIGGDPTTLPGDSLDVDGGGLDAEIDSATGAITVAGAQPITTSEVEEVSLANVATLTVVGDIADDNIAIAADSVVAAGDLLTVGGRTFAIKDITSLVVDGGDGDDALVFDTSSGSPTTPVTFHGGLQQGSGAGDRISVIGSFITQTLNYTAPGTDGNTGTIDMDGTVLTYTGLEPIDAGNSVDTILNFNTGLANDALLQDNIGFGSIELLDNGATFEDTVIPNPSNSLTINLDSQGDTLTVTTLDGDYAASMIIVGGAGNDLVQFTDTTISNTPGRGLDVVGVETLNISGSDFSNNTADVGGGLRVIGGITTIDNSTFTGNIATGDAANQGGGGIFVDGTMTIQNNSVISGNAATGASGSGGGIFLAGGTLTVNNSSINTNTANRAGGGIEDASGAGLGVTLNSVALNDNVASGSGNGPGNGGGLHITGDGQVNITGGSVSGNTAEAEGGGLWNSATGTLTVQGTSILNNVARGDAAPGAAGTDVQGGGGIFNDGGTLSIDSATISGNAAIGATAGSGGGVLSIAGTVQIDNTTIESNEAVRAGGGIEVVGGSMTLVQTDLNDNDVSADDLLGLGLDASPGNGGGLHVTANATVRIEGGTVSGNTAEAEGGGLWNSASGTLILDGATGDVDVINNFARGDAPAGALGADIQGGGGIFNNGGTLTLSGNTNAPNVTVADNAAAGTTNGSGGGILSIGGNVTISDSFVRGNEAVRAGGGIEIVDGAVSITSTEISGNDVSAVDLLGLGLGASPGNGGGLHVTGPADVTISAGAVLNNAAGLEGGGLWNNAGTMTIEGGAVIDGNSASGDAADDGGGGIFNNGGTLVIRDAATTISNNTADGISGSGGGIFNNTGGSLTVTDAAITGNVANRAGGGIEDASGAGLSVTLTGINLSGNNAGVAPAIANPGNGGGLHVTGAGDVLVDGGTIGANTAALEGGGLWNGTGTMTIQNGAIINANVAQGDALDDGGGGVFNNGGSVNVTGISTTISSNLATGVIGSGGGLLSVGDGTISVTDATITGNSAGGDGGGISAEGGDGSVTLLRANIDSNTASDSGGGVLVQDSTVTITDSVFTGNQALGLAATDGAGGGLFIGGNLASGSFTITNTDFTSNSALGGGGGIDLFDVDGTITGGSFNSNSVTGNGITFDTGAGAIAIVGGTRVTSVDISDVTVDGNLSPAAGGIGIVDSQVTITGSTISNNRSTDPLGGAGGIGTIATVAIGGNLLEVDSSTIAGNTTAGEGGGIGVINGDLLVIDTTIVGNSADGGRGGGIGVLNASAAGSAIVRSSTISSNTASVNGGGIAVLNSGLDLLNVTLVGNDAQSAGGGIAYDNNLGTVTRSIAFSTISSNTSGSGGSNISAVGSAIDVAGSIFNDGVCAAPGGAINSLGGNLDSADTCGFSQPSDLVNTDPLLGSLQDNGGPVFTLELLTGSPAIDAALSPGPATDARGVTRPLDGDGNGTPLPDMGAFEAASANQLMVADVTVDEDAGSATVSVLLPVAVSSGFTVDFDVSAIAPATTEDHSEARGTLVFAGTAGETQTFDVPIVDDNEVEPVETLLVSLSNPSDLSIDTSDTGLVTIIDDDLVILTVSDVTANESDGIATVTVSIDNSVQDGFTVDFATSDDSAVAPADYTDTFGTLTFAGNGGESQTFDVPIVADLETELDEQFTVATSNVVTLGSFPAPITSIDATDIGTVIIQDVPPATIQGTKFNDFNGDGDDENGTDPRLPGVSIVVSGDRDGDGDLDTLVDVTDSAGVYQVTGLAAGSYEVTEAPLTINSYTILGDNTPILVNQSATFDGLPETFASALVVNERVDVIDETQQWIEVSFDASSGGLAADVNANWFANFNIQTDKAFSVAESFVYFRNGDVPQLLSTFGTLQHPFDPSVGTINDLGDTRTTTTDETLGIFSNPFASLLSAGGVDPNVITGVTLGYRLILEDTPRTPTTPIPVNVTLATSEIATDAANFTGGVNETVVTDLLIGNNVATPTLTVDDVTVNEDEGTAIVSVSVNNVVPGGFTVDFSTSDGTATEPDDYTQTIGTLSFLGDAGESQSFSVPIIDDFIVEPIETINIFLANPSVVTIDASDTAVIDIINDDTAALTITDVTVDEDASTATVEVTVDNEVEGGFTVDISTTDGTAVQSGDYTQSQATLSFLGNALEIQTLIVPIVDDTIVEDTETINLSLSAVSVFDVDASDTGVISIFDDDLATLSVIDVAVDEAVGSATVTVAVDSVVQGGFMVDVSTSDGTATEPADYTQTMTTLTFTETGGLSQTFNVPIIDDLDVEADETIVVSLANVTVPLVDAPDTGLITIIDDDSPTTNSIVGRVFCDADADDTFDIGEQAVDEVVFLDENGNAELDGNERSTLTDSNGNYRFDNVVGTDHTVVTQIPASCNTITDLPVLSEVALDVGNLATSIDSVDLDNDGDRDIVVTADLSHSLTVLRNDGGVFTRVGAIDSLQRPQAVFAFEPQQSFAPVVAVAGVGTPEDGGGIFLFDQDDFLDLNNPSGGLSGAVPLLASSGNGPVDVLLDDIDGDDLVDIVSGAFRSSDLTVQLSSLGQTLTIDSDAGQLFSIASGNVDPSNSAPEIVVAGIGYDSDTTADPRIEVFQFAGGAFSKTATLPTAPSVVSIIADDILGNGVDEVIALSHSGTLTAYSFAGATVASVETSVAPGASSFAIGDFNGDGMKDVAVANLEGQFVELLTGNGEGRFAHVTTIGGISAPSDLVVDDFNGDGFGDLGIANYVVDANIDIPGSSPSPRLPSTATIVLLDVASAEVIVESTTTTFDFDFPTADPTVLLDVNGDSLISARDALLVINAIARNSLAAEGEFPSQPARAATDVNGDGQTSAIDALMIINHLSQAETAEGILVEGLSEEDDDRDSMIEAIDLIMSRKLV